MVWFSYGEVCFKLLDISRACKITLLNLSELSHIVWGGCQQ